MFEKISISYKLLIGLVLANLIISMGGIIIAILKLFLLNCYLNLIFFFYKNNNKFKENFKRKFLEKCSLLEQKKNKKINLFIPISAFLNTSSLIACGISVSYTSIQLMIKLLSYGLNFNNTLKEYLVLTLTLVFVAYFPEKFVFITYDFIDKLSSKLANKITITEIRSEFEPLKNKTKKYIKWLRPKLWMYFIAILFTLINSIEKMSGLNIVNLKIWLQIKPIVIESVFTILVVDRFVNQFKNEKDKIVEEFKELNN